uniref:Uncharacterized protein n=1 Tax=Siphoviridae sp. ctKvA22 TaxID=2826246 RepID=A0A8S5MA61_9CAUD|nr:MAG TPA: hypothetical protein [Siphoviridae sp. ctKvA22]
MSFVQQKKRKILKSFLNDTKSVDRIKKQG